MRWRCWRSPRPRPGAGPCRGRRSSPRCAAAGGNATSRSAPSRSRPRCVSRSWSSHRSWPTPTAPSFTSYVRLLAGSITQVAALESELAALLAGTRTLRSWRANPGSAPSSAPGCSPSSGTTPHRYADAKARKNYSGMSPITKASGTKRRRARPLRAQQTLRRRALPASLRRADSLTRSPPLLRHTASPRSHSPSSIARAGEPARRRPARLPAPPSPLRRNGRMATSRQTKRRRRRLTNYTPWDV